ncbi:forkhead box protein M1-like [Halichoeres trimaculatus]|uniref:forkhead box protein M1-like n=1 Tax=Halichoeres trimaculatus TaxID=147232 RepID=UPI003D9E3B28
MTMTRSPTRPLIFRRKKLPFQQNDLSTAEPQPAPSRPKEPTKPEISQCFPDGIRIMDHPSMSDTQVVFIPKTIDCQSVIDALSDKSKTCGAQGRNKFMLVCENGSRGKGLCCQHMNELSPETTAGQPVKEEFVSNTSDVLPFTAVKPFDDLESGLLDNSLTDIQWLGNMSACDFESDPTEQMANKKNQNPDSPYYQVSSESAQRSTWERPPYSYMNLIQFAINSQMSRRMSLKEIYMWIEDHFPYFREVAKPGWKNSIRHNLSLHSMFVREMSPVGKVSLWTIRPEVNRYLTLDKVNRQRKILTDIRNTTSSSEKTQKSFPQRTKSSLISVQPPAISPMCMLSPHDQFHPLWSQKQIPSRGVKRVWIAPKVSQSDVPPSAMCSQGTKVPKMEMDDEPISIKCETPKFPPKRQSSSSRRKQNLVDSVKDEPILLCTANTFSDSDGDPDASSFQDMDFSPIGTPVKPLHNYITFSLSSTPVKDWPLLAPPREPLTSTSSRGTDAKGCRVVSLRRSCPRELLLAGDSTAASISVREGLDAMNESLSEILVDLGFPCLDEEDLSSCNISLSEVFSVIK